MAFESLTDDKIMDLLNCPKHLVNPQARMKIKDGHEQVNYKAVSTDGSDIQFEIYKRQNLNIIDDFSCGISWITSNGEVITLKRYNGPSHNHCNQLEKEKIGYNSHIHHASEKYIKANKKPEGYAERTSKYQTLEGALHCLVKDCNINGISTSPDITNQTKLFEHES